MKNLRVQMPSCNFTPETYQVKQQCYLSGENFSVLKTFLCQIT